jgi:hypothetical protein
LDSPGLDSGQERLSLGSKVARHVKFTTHNHVLPNLGMSGAMPFFFTSQKRDDFLKRQLIEDKICVLISLQLLPKTSHSKTTSEI